MSDYFYDYDASRAYAAAHDMPFMEEWLPGVDEAFIALDLTQVQVDTLMREYIWRVKHLFTPANYTFMQRVMIALFFLRGK